MIEVKIKDTRFHVASDLFAPFWEDIDKGNLETQAFHIIDTHVNKGSTVLDIGCWCGPMSFFMASKGAIVHSVDPDPVVNQQIKINIELNPQIKSLIHLHPLAITAQTGNFLLYARSGYGYSSTSTLHRIRDKVATSECMGITFDQFTSDNHIEKIDFIKMDIEGGEFDIADQLAGSLKKFNYPTLLLSLHYTHMNEAIYHQKKKSKRVALLMMKIEKWFHVYFYKKELIQKMTGIIHLCKAYRHTYNMDNQEIKKEDLTANFLLNQKINDILLIHKN